MHRPSADDVQHFRGQTSLKERFDFPVCCALRTCSCCLEPTSSSLIAYAHRPRAGEIRHLPCCATNCPHVSLWLCWRIAAKTISSRDNVLDGRCRRWYFSPLGVDVSRCRDRSREDPDSPSRSFIQRHKGSLVDRAVCRYDRHASKGALIDHVSCPIGRALSLRCTRVGRTRGPHTASDEARCVHRLDLCTLCRTNHRRRCMASLTDCHPACILCVGVGLGKGDTPRLGSCEFDCA